MKKYPTSEHRRRAGDNAPWGAAVWGTYPLATVLYSRCVPL